MYKNNKGIEEFFDDSWAHMHGLLDEHFPEKEKKKRRIVFWFWTGLAVCVFGGAVLYWLPKSEVNITNSTTPEFIRDTQQEPKIATIESPNKTDVVIAPKVSPKPIDPIVAKKQPTTPNDLQNSNNQVTISPIVVIDYAETLETNIQQQKHIKPLKTPIVTLENPSIPLRDKAKILKPLPQLPNELLFAKAVQLKRLNHKPKKKIYYELYAGASSSNLGYSSGFLGANMGRTIAGRWSTELGVGYRMIYSTSASIDSMAKTLKFFVESNEYDILSVGPSSSQDMDESASNVRLHLVEMPLKLRFRLTPNWSIYGDIIGVYQFSKQLTGTTNPQSTYSNSLERSDHLPVQDLTAHFYMGVGGGIAYERNHWQWSFGYNNWAQFRPDNQLYIGTKYRF